MSRLRVARGCALIMVLSSTACADGCVNPFVPDLDDAFGGGDPEREAHVDLWQQVWEAPAANFEVLAVGGRLHADNFANRGDIEVRYVDDSDQIVVEMQRFTVASDLDAAQRAFDRMLVWTYDLALPELPSEDIADHHCDVSEARVCFVRAQYDGLFQPLRDGANFRVTLPRGWDGELHLETEDNLGDGLETYPDRSDVRVDGLAGDLRVQMASGRLEVVLDPELEHCGCDTPTRILAETWEGFAADMTVDLGDADGWYSVLLENRAASPVCPAVIDCDGFASCSFDPDLLEVEQLAQAELGFPGAPAQAGGGIAINLVSDECGPIAYARGPSEYDEGPFLEERRGDLRVCVGCL